MLALLSLAAALAQSVNVNVMPLRDVLPPQVMYYLSNPGQYFNITVQNPSTEAQQIFFGAELRQVTPASGLEVVVPAKTMPRQPIEVGAGATRVLTAAEMRTMFNHVRSSDVSMPSNLFSDVTSGSFGNLPEGTYEIIINAYQWNPNTPTPVLISNPALSRTMFRVCYQAKAPEWLMPVSTGDFENRDIATLVKQTPILTWTAPQVNCDPKPRNYTYDLKIVQQMPLQDPLEAIERNPVVYQVTGLTVAQCMLPASIVNGLSPFETYVAQVTARSNATQIGALDYINIQNDGRSQLRLFRIKDYSSSSPDGRVTFAPPVVSDPMMAAGGDTLSAQRSVTIDWKAPVSDNPSVLPVTFSYELKAVEAVKDMDLSSEAARRSLMESQPALYEAKNLRTLSHDLPAETFAKAKGSMDVLVQVTARPDTIAGSHRKYIFTDEGRSAPVRFTVGKGGIRIVGLGADGDAPDSLYVFNNPRITSPYFAPDGGARKLFVGDALNLNWERPRYYSGDGVRQDTIRFSYDVELYAAREYKDREEMLKEKPIYTNRNLTQRSDSISWSVLGEKVAKGDYLFLRVVPKSLNEESIHFLNDSLNTFDAAMAERISHNFFKCRNQIEIENTNPTARSADDLRGSEVMVGEYKLILDGDLKAVEGKPGHFSGNGHVVWSPLLLTWKLAVEFSDIAINTEDQVYEGVVETWGGKEGVKMRSSEVVDKLFSDWGIDNLIGDTGLPYADRLQEEANGKIRGLADDLPEIAEYYQDFQKGKAFVSNLLKGNLEDVTFPLEIPEEYNTTPVGLTINKMKFAPTFATMDIFGTCVVPESEVTQKQILVFGAPRLCISPSSLIPEGGMVALLKDFVIEEKKTGFECTFKAPTDVIEPADGCFVAWSDNKFVGLTLDVDMKMPEDLKKVDSSGKPTEESPMLHIKTTLSSWDDFLVEANLDEFEHVDLPGFTFGASTVIVDLSATRNGDGMVFPKEDFDRAKAGISTGQDELWEGLFIKKINMRFPESIKIGNGDDPMSFTMENMFIDRSGITLDAGLKNIIDYSTGKEGEIDGFKYTLDHLYISIIQNNFNKFYFDGQLNIPLFKGTVYYTCNIYNQSYTQKGTGKGYAYVFKTTQIEDLDFDFMLGELKLDHRLTYFLIEALPDASGELKTNVELCVGGGVTVAGAKTVNKKLAKLPFDLSLPQLKFCNMRLANGKRFESVYADSLQKRDRAATEVIVDAVAEGSYGWWNEAKDIELCGGKLVLNFGQWGAIAMNSDPSKPSASEWFEGLPDEVNKAVDDAIEKGKNAVDNAIDAAGKAVDNAIDAAGKAVDAAGKAVDNAIDAAGKAAESAGKAIDSALDKATGGSGGGNTKKFLDYDENSPGYGPSVAEVPYEAVAPAAAGSNKSLSCKVGPFRFALTDWGFDYVVTDGEPYLAIKIGGDITFSDDLDVTAGTTLEIQSYVKNISKPSEISLEYKDLKFREARLDIETAVLSFQGVLAVDGDAGGIGGTDKGYKGKLSCKVKGGIFEMDVQGGYFNHKEEGNNFSWGFFDVMVGGKMGIPMPPVALNNIRGGLYINCVYNTSDKLNPRPRKGAIGLVFGMGITTSDGEAIKGRLDLTVAFDTKKKTLTTFLFNGSVTAVGGIVKSKVKLVYEDNEQERYFQLNLTMDAAFDGGELKEIMNELNGALSEVKSQVDAVAGEFKEIKETAEESFKSGMGDQSKKKNEDYEKDMASYEKKKAEDKDKSDDGTSFSGPSLKVSLDLYIGHKKPGGATKWHLYLGEPDHDKRCEFTLVNFKSKIVSVAIGANAYFCLGNELPNNGQLPPIPEKVRRFLDGGEKGGVKSDNISEANDARAKARNDFLANAKTSGGVMLGASVWGYVDVNLGLFYGDMGATAGFDVSIRHLKGNNTCMNLGKAPGINGWYGEGQLYAYLYAKFGLKINLGFFKKKLDLFNAGIGGVLKCAMPNPNYFTGKARVKVELLGGLVKLNKKFSFECGDVCEMFYGNALDDYVLFESCNIGLKSWDEAEKAKISWDIQSNPIVMTQADLNVPIRVVDPTQLNRLQNHSSGDGKSEETLKDLASRQFRFKMDASLPPTLTEYSSLSDAKANRNGVVYEMTHRIYKEKVTLSVDQLHRNKYYKVTISGYAQEFYNGSWRDPETYDTIKNKYVAQAWKQTKEFYFATNNAEMSFKDDEDLYPHVKLMYPNQGKPGNREDMMFNYSANGQNYSYAYTPAYWEDVKQPIISLARPMKGKAYQKGRLKWYLYSNGKLLSTRENQWIETNNYSILTPQFGFANVPETNNADYIIRLRYEWTETKTSPATWVVARTYNVWGTSAKQVRTKAMKDNGINAYGRVLNKKVEVSEAGLMNVNDNDTVGAGRRKFIVTVYERKAGKVTREFVKDLLALKVTVTKQGVNGNALYNDPLYYCSKFMATRLDKITYDGQNLEMNDDQLLITSANQRGGFVPYYNTENPFIYLSYMSRMFFIGGHKFVSAKNNLNLTVQSTQSLWLETPYGSWRDGILKNRYIGQIREGRKSIEFALTMGTYRFQDELGTAYPLYSDHSSVGYTQWLGNSSSLFDGHKLTEEAYARVFAEVYNIAEDMHNNIIRRVGSQIYYSKSSMRDWLASYAGSKEQTYDDAESGVYAFVPRYQYGVVWNAASRCGLNISKTIEMDKEANRYRHVRIKGDKGDFLGRTLYFAYADKDHKKYVDDDYKSQSQVLQFNAWKALRNNNMRLYFKRYRVNAWDYKNRQWTVYPLQYSDKRFTTTYNDLLKNLVVKYNIPLRGKSSNTNSHKGTGGVTGRGSTVGKGSNKGGKRR